MEEMVSVTRHRTNKILRAEVLHTNGTLGHVSTAWRLLIVQCLLLRSPVVRVSILKAVESVGMIFSSIRLIVEGLKIFQNG